MRSAIRFASRPHLAGSISTQYARQVSPQIAAHRATRMACAAAKDCKMESIKVVGLCGSLRAGGLTKQALETALKGAAQTHATVELIDLNDYNLYFCDGLESESVNAKTKVPNDVAKLREKIRGAQGIILATPEYHNSFSGVLKNALDLCGFEEFEGKIVGLVAVAGGAFGGLQAMNSLRDICRSLHAWVIPEQAGVPQAWKNLKDPSMTKRLEGVGRQVATYAHLHSSDRAKEFLELIQKAAPNPGGTAELQVDA